MFDSGMNLVTTVIGFVMSATFILFICTRLICGRFRRPESRPMFELDSRIDLEQAEGRVRGLEPVLVAAIPTMKFNHEAFKSTNDTQCSICLGDYQEKEVLRIMPKCGHNFHLSCIDTWLRKQSTCPVCRLSLQDSVTSKPVSCPRPPTTFTRTPSLDDSEVSFDNSRHWLLPASNSTSGESGRNRDGIEAVTRNPSSTPYGGEVEIT